MSLICSSCFSFFIPDDIPFFINDVRRKEHIKLEMDSFANLLSDQQFEEFDSEHSVVSSYSSWTLVDGIYEREVITYYANKFFLEELDAIVKNFSVSNLNIKGTKVE